MTARTSFTPAVTAESSTKSRSAAPATRCASVVFPVPGGPHRIADSGPATPPAPSVSRRRGLPGRRISSCPRTSSRERGRIRAASGCSGAGVGPSDAGPSAALKRSDTRRRLRRGRDGARQLSFGLTSRAPCGAGASSSSSGVASIPASARCSGVIGAGASVSGSYPPPDLGKAMTSRIES